MTASAPVAAWSARPSPCSRSPPSAPVSPPPRAPVKTLLNVSYDVSREFYKDYNTAFAAHWKKTTGAVLTLNQSHGGSSRQARSVVEGLEADVITMNQANDIDLLAERGALIPADWARRLPDNAAPDDLGLGDSGAQGQPEEHPRLERPRQARRRA